MEFDQGCQKAAFLRYFLVSSKNESCEKKPRKKDTNIKIFYKIGGKTEEILIIKIEKNHTKVYHQSLSFLKPNVKYCT